jgi:hypothetical protein
MERAKRWQELQKLAEEYRAAKVVHAEDLTRDSLACWRHCADVLADAAEEYVLDSCADPDDSMPDYGEQ